MFGWLALATVLLYAFLRAAMPASPRTDPGLRMPKGEKRFNVYRRDDKWLAMRLSSRAGYLAGFFFSLLFFVSVPFFIWRYGIVRTVVLFLVPVIGAYSSATLLGFDILGSDFVIVPFQAVAGLWVAAHDVEFRSKPLEAKGWVHIGCGWASKSRDAIHTFSVPPQH